MRKKDKNPGILNLLLLRNASPSPGSLLLTFPSPTTMMTPPMTFKCYDNPSSARDSFSTSNVNATDVFSLSEAINVLEKSEGPDALEFEETGRALKRMAESREDTSPSFMINKFLPDANAMTMSSALIYCYYCYSRSWNNKTSYRSYSSGCTGTGDEVEVQAEGRRYRKTWDEESIPMEDEAEVLVWGQQESCSSTPFHFREPAQPNPS